MQPVSEQAVVLLLGGKARRTEQPSSWSLVLTPGAPARLPHCTNILIMYIKENETCSAILGKVGVTLPEAMVTRGPSAPQPCASVPEPGGC